MALLPLWIRLLIGVFAGGLFLAYYQERVAAGDSVVTAAGKTVVASPVALYKFIAALLTKATAATTSATTSTIGTAASSATKK